MLKDIKNTIKQSAIYGLSRISLKFVSFILTPVISIYFTVSEYGILDRFERFWQILFAFSLFGMETAILRWYTLTDNIHRKKRIVFTITAFLIVLNVVLIVIGLLFSKFFSKNIFDTEIYNKIIVYTFLISAFEALMVIPLSLLRSENKVFKYLIITITATVISLLLQLYFLLYTNIKLEGIFISKFVAPFVTFIVLIPYLLKHIEVHFDKENLIQILKFCFPLLLTGIVSNLLISVNRFILGYLGTSTDVGLFSLASNMSGLITFLLISPFQLAFNAIFWQKIKDANAARFFTKSVTYSVLLYVWGALILSLLIPYIIKLYIPKTPAYWDSVNIIPVISMSLVFYGMLTILYMSYHHAKRNDLIFYLLLISLAVNVVFNVISIPIWGVYGASYSTGISYLILVVMLYFFSKKLYFIKYETTKLVIIFLSASLFIAFFYYFGVEVKWIDITLRIIVCLAFPAVLIPFRIYEKVEIDTAKRIFGKLLKYKKFKN